MMRTVVSASNDQHGTYFAHLVCGHKVASPTPYHTNKTFTQNLWCDICNQINITNTEQTQFISNQDCNEAGYKDPLWHEGKESTPTLDSFQKLLHDVQKIHDKKKHDYSQPGDRWSNFTESGIIGSMFKNPTDNAFAVLIGVKLARLSNLLGNKLIPNNESIDDTFLDLTTYCALWAAYHKDNK